MTVLLDEAWTMIQTTVGGQMLARTIRRGRKYGLRQIISTQRVEDVLQTDAGRTILGNCYTKVLMQMESAEVDRAREAFKLTVGEEAFLRSCGRTEQYADCLLLLGPQHVGLRVLRAPAEIHRLITG